MVNIIPTPFPSSGNPCGIMLSSLNLDVTSETTARYLCSLYSTLLIDHKQTIKVHIIIYCLGFSIWMLCLLKKVSWQYIIGFNYN